MTPSDQVGVGEGFSAVLRGPNGEVKDQYVDGVKIRGRMVATLRSPDGEAKQVETVDNLIVTVGKNSIADQLLASPAVTKPTHMAVGTGTNAAAAGDTALQTELDRNALTSKTRGANNIITMVGDWAAGDATGAITEAGILNAGASGDLYSRAVFSVINKGALDTLSITWTFTVG